MTHSRLSICAALACALLAGACSNRSTAADATWLDGGPARDSDTAITDLAAPDAAGDAGSDARLLDAPPPDADTDGFENPNFTIRIIETSFGLAQAGRQVSLALSGGKAFFAHIVGGLRFVELGANGMPSVSTVGPSFGVEFCDIAVGGGLVAIASRSQGVPTLWTQSVSWNSTAAANAGGAHIALFVDSVGKAHICHNDSRGEVLHYSYQDAGGTFTTETIAGTQQSGQRVGAFCDIVVDGNGGVHVSYERSNWLDMHYAHRPSTGGWTSVTAAKDAQGKVGSYTAIRLDSSGSPVIAYFRLVDNSVALASRQGNMWSSETIDSAGAIGAWTSLAVDGTGALHVSYYDSSRRWMRYAKRAQGSSTWQTQTLAVLRASAGYNDIAVDSQNKAHIAFQHNHTVGQSRLEYAKEN